MNSKYVAIISTSISVLLTILLIFARSSRYEIECVRATIDWYEDLEADYVPWEPQNSPIVIENGEKLQTLFAMFSQNESDQGVSAGWAGCVQITFDFSCGHQNVVIIDNGLSTWVGLGSVNDQDIPPEFPEFFAREFNLKRKDK